MELVEIRRRIEEIIEANRDCSVFANLRSSCNSSQIMVGAELKDDPKGTSMSFSVYPAREDGQLKYGPPTRTTNSPDEIYAAFQNWLIGR